MFVQKFTCKFATHTTNLQRLNEKYKQMAAINQKELYNKAFKKMLPEVTEEDRILARDFVKVNATTISNYLNGRVRSLDTACRLLTFFKSRIDERTKVLKEIL